MQFLFKNVQYNCCFVYASGECLTSSPHLEGLLPVIDGSKIDEKKPTFKSQKAVFRHSSSLPSVSSDSSDFKREGRISRNTVFSLIPILLWMCSLKEQLTN